MSRSKILRLCINHVGHMQMTMIKLYSLTNVGVVFFLFNQTDLFISEYNQAIVSQIDCRRSLS